MHLEIVTPDKNIFSGDIELIRLPGSKGAFEILNNHAPIISTLGKGEIKVIDEEKKVYHFPIDHGVVECIDNKVVVLVDK